MPDIMAFSNSGHTQKHTHRHTLKRNTGACGSLQSRTQGIKNRDRSWIYKYGGKIRGSENQSRSGSVIGTLTVLYNRTMMNLNQLKHSGTGEINVNSIRYDWNLLRSNKLVNKPVTWRNWNYIFLICDMLYNTLLLEFEDCYWRVTKIKIT